MQRIRTLLLSALLAATALGAAACTKESGKGAATSADPSVDGRLARLERRFDALLEALEPRLGPAEPNPALVYSVPIAAEDPVAGPADAKVTIVEGYEFACPFCFKAHPTVKQVLATYGQDVRLVSKYMVVHEQAIGPGLAACAANLQGKYPEMVDQIWTKVFEARNGDPAVLEAIATELGLDVARFKTDMESPACVAWLQGSAQTLSQLGANGTPAFFINGRFINGAQPFAEFKKVIDEELAKADKAIAKGVAKADYYKTAVVDKGLTKSKWAFEDDAPPAAAPAAPAATAQP
jgi:predicted DsbA family dithiol-disulfide isomerase